MKVLARSRASVVAVAVSTALAGVLAAAVAPSASAIDNSIVMPTPTVAFPPASQGSAIATGARVFVGNSTYQVAVGVQVTADFGAVTYKAGVTPAGWRGYWYACTTADQALDNCTLVKRQNSDGNEAATGKTVAYTVKAEDLGKYLAFKGEAYGTDVLLSQDKTMIAISDRDKDVRVVPSAIPTSARPILGLVDVTAGEKAGLVTAAWTMPAGMTFGSRTVAAWICDSADAGQVATAAFSTSGCTSIDLPASTTAASTNNVAAYSIPTTTAMGGKYLLAQSTLAARTDNGQAYLFQVRSATGLLAVDPNSIKPSPTPTPSASPSASPSPSATPTQPAVAPVKPTLAIKAKPSVARGGKLLVTVTLSAKGNGTLGVGEAMVELVKGRNGNAKVVKRLRSIEVESLRGARYEPISRRIEAGAYYLRVVFTDAGSGVQAASLKKLVVR